MVLRDAVARFHKEGLARSRRYLERRLRGFKNDDRKEATLDKFLWYTDECTTRAWPTFQTRMNVEVRIPRMPPDLICTGQIARVDLVPEGGYAAWLLRNATSEGWADELRVPLIQSALATAVLNVDISEVSVGVYGFEDRQVRVRCFTSAEIESAERELDVLLRALGY
jgi:hypothetical protein